MEIIATFTLGYSNFGITNLCKRNYFTHIEFTVVSSTEMALHTEEERKSQPLDKQHYCVYTIKFLDLTFLTCPEGHALDPPSHSLVTINSC